VFFNNSRVTDWSPIAHIGDNNAGANTSTSLDFTHGGINDEMLARMVADGTIPQSVEHLTLTYNQITDISPLRGLTNLQSLRLNHNQIVDISPLAGMTNMGSLDLGYNQIVDVSVLANMPELTHLWLRNNQIRDISSLTDLTNLQAVWLGMNPIIDHTPAHRGESWNDRIIRHG
jgi:internalin A